jgi:tetratricopeptide (TPR) repeat protein
MERSGRPVAEPPPASTAGRPDPGSLPVRLADLIERSLFSDEEAAVVDRGAQPGGGEPPDGGDAEATPSRQLSALLAELARIPDADLDAIAPWAAAPRPGDEVGRFVIQRELGRGGFGLVFEAFDTHLRRAVAFKLVRPGARGRARSESLVRSEAEAVARLNHPNIVTLHDLDRCPAGPYLIFELLHGETLAERLRRGPLPLRDVVHVGVEVARALSHAHAADVVHRDLKPGNVFLCADGAVKVLDFGLAHLFGRAAAKGGTPAYMAPEQWRAEPGDARTDLFALGVLVHEMLAGALPYRVSRDRSEALDPGPPPLLPRSAAPAPLRALVARLLEKDPAARPPTAQVVLDALLPIERRLARRAGARARLAAAAGLAAAAAVALAVWRSGPAGGARQEPPLVVVADVANETGDDALGGVSGLLITSLEQSRHVRILSRSRVLGLIRHLRQEAPPLVDHGVGREVARAAGAPILLVGTAGRAGAEYTLALRAVDPRGDEELFTVSQQAAAKDDVPDALDRLSEDARRRLGEREEDIRAARIRLREAVTPSVDAYRHYFLGQDCMERPTVAGSWVAVGRCAEHFRAALSLDPTFALAHHQLAFLLETEAGPGEEVEAHLASALRHLERAPPRERALIRAWKAHVEGRDEEALATYEAFADDKQALYLAGDLHYHRGELAAAVPFFERVLTLDPGAEWPLDHLVNALGVLRRDEDLRRRVAALRAERSSAARAHAIVRGLVWLGEAGEALEVARGAVASGGGASAEADLAGVLSTVGRFEEAEALLRARAAADPASPAAAAALASVLRAQGRRAEALRLLDEAARTAGPEAGKVRYVRAMLAADDGDAAAFWREVASAAALAPRSSANLAVLLALRGDLPQAHDLAAALAPGSIAAEQHAAVAAWRRGDPAGAAARLAALEARDPSPADGLAPSYLLAEVSSDAGDDAGALAAVERFQRLWPRGTWRGWAYPRSIYLAALAHERLGRRDLARAEIDRLLELWRDADPGLPLLREARALRARVGG